jgi:ABC-2 type transport system permease protein
MKASEYNPGIMKKYWIIMKNEVQKQFTYRANIAAYAFGNIGELIALAVVWIIIYKNIDTIQGYTSNEMITYVVIAWFFSYLTTTYDFENVIAKDIYRGTLSGILVKPLSYAKYMMTIATGRVAIAFCIVLVQGVVVYSLFRNYIVFSMGTSKLFLLLLMLLATYMINLFLSILIGFIAFWTIEIHGVYYSLKVFSRFMSGAFFPIALLPAFFLKFSYFLPFVYTIYIPVQLYLGKISFAEGLRGLAMQILWLVILYVIIKIVWTRGLKRYESVGI